MIPLRLALRNFMCYRENVPPLELEHVRLACLTGDNGAGKSTLLDAITWVLWGKARVNGDLDLMSLGATEMQVDFEFRLGELDYRISRRRTRKGAAGLWLDLFCRDVESDSWRPLTGDGVRQTQARIVDLLKMEYDTFINSAFLLQGRADEFTTKSPAQRKEVLGEILGLATYDDLERRAREHYRERGDRLREADAEALRLQAVIETEPGLRAEQQRLAALTAELEAELGRQLTARQLLQAELIALQQEEQQLSGLRTRLATDQRQRQQLERLVAERERSIAQHTARVARRAEIEAGARRLDEAQQRCTAFEAALRALRTLETQTSQLERTIAQALGGLRAEQQTLTRSVTELGRQAARRAELAAQREELARAAMTATQLEGEIAALKEQERAAHGECEGLKVRNEVLRAEMLRLKERQEQVDGADARCPLCRRPLSEHDKEHIHSDYQADGLALKEQYQANRRRIEQLTTLSQQLQQQSETLTHQARRAQLEAREEARLSQQLAQAQQAEQEQAAAQLRLVEIAARIERADYAAPEQAQRRTLADQMAVLAYDEDAHEASRAELATLTPFAAEAAALQQALERLPGEQEELALHQASIAHLAGHLTQLEAEIATLTQRVQSLPALRDQERTASVQIEANSRARDSAQRELGAAESRLAGCQQARQRLDALTRERQQIAEQRELYGELIEAFGKKGIQAMVIETVVPEVQDEANRLLDRMSGNSMRVEFQTQRDSRAGDTIETLDVIIKDEVGARKYELYSGGEAFRVNFAIRVALSKLLARRAGARLQMLVIDEGFGTQDSRGREGLIEAIRSIEPDFATILVITHLADIRDEFSTRIDVTKGVDGSLVAVN